MFLHPVHSNSKNPILEITPVNNFIQSFATKWSNQFINVKETIIPKDYESFKNNTDFIPKQSEFGILPKEVKIFYDSKSIILPCFILVSLSRFGMAYKIFYPFIIITLSNSQLQILEKKYGKDLLPLSYNIDNQEFEKAEEQLILHYVFKRYIDLYYNMGMKSFDDDIVKANVPLDDSNYDAVTSSSIVDAEERLELLLFISQPFLQHFFPFLPKKNKMLIPGQLKELPVQYNTKINLTSEDESFINYITLREWKEDILSFSPLEVSIYQFCSQIMHLLTHKGDVMYIIDRNGKIEKDNPYHPIFQIFVVYMLYALKNIKSSTSIIKNDREFTIKEKQLYNSIYRIDEEKAKLILQDLEKTPYDASFMADIFDLKKNLSSIGSLIHYAYENEQNLPSNISNLFRKLHIDCNHSKIKETFQDSYKSFTMIPNCHFVHETLDNMFY